MQYVKIVLNNGYAGCRIEEYLAFKNTASQEYIDEYAQEMLSGYAENYSYVATGWGTGFEDEADESYYYENCYFDWELVTKEEWEENEGTYA